MDLIEKVLGISPDGGNGITELTLFFALALAVGCGWLAFRRTMARPSSRRSLRLSSRLSLRLSSRLSSNLPK